MCVKKAVHDSEDPGQIGQKEEKRDSRSMESLTGRTVTPAARWIVVLPSTLLLLQRDKEKEGTPQQKDLHLRC